MKQICNSYEIIFHILNSMKSWSLKTLSSNFKYPNHSAIIIEVCQ